MKYLLTNCSTFLTIQNLTLYNCAYDYSNAKLLNVDNHHFIMNKNLMFNHFNFVH